MSWFKDTLSMVQEKSTKWKETVTHTMDDIQRKAGDVARTAQALGHSYVQAKRENAADAITLLEQQARGLQRPLSSRDVVRRWNQCLIGDQRFVAEEKTESGHITVRDLHFKHVFLRSRALEFCVQSIARNEELRQSLLPFPSGDDGQESSFSHEIFILLSNTMRQPQSLWLQAFCLILDDGTQSRMHAGLFKLLHGLKLDWEEAYLHDERASLETRKEILRQQWAERPLSVNTSEKRPRVLFQTLNSLTERSHSSREVCRLSASLHDNLLTSVAHIEEMRTGDSWEQLRNELSENIDKLDCFSSEQNGADRVQEESSMVASNLRSQLGELVGKRDLLEKDMEAITKEREDLLAQLEVVVRRLAETRSLHKAVVADIAKMEVEIERTERQCGARQRVEDDRKEYSLRHHAALVAISSLVGEAAAGFSGKFVEQKAELEATAEQTHSRLIESAKAHLMVEEPRLQVAINLVEICVQQLEDHLKAKNATHGLGVPHSVSENELILQLQQSLRSRDIIWQEIDRFHTLYSAILERETPRIEALASMMKTHKDNFDTLAISLINRKEVPQDALLLSSKSAPSPKTGEALAVPPPLIQTVPNKEASTSSAVRPWAEQIASESAEAVPKSSLLADESVMHPVSHPAATAAPTTPPETQVELQAQAAAIGPPPAEAGAQAKAEAQAQLRARAKAMTQAQAETMAQAKAQTFSQSQGQVPAPSPASPNPAPPAAQPVPPKPTLPNAHPKPPHPATATHAESPQPAAPPVTVAPPKPPSQPAPPKAAPVTPLTAQPASPKLRATIASQAPTNVTPPLSGLVGSAAALLDAPQEAEVVVSTRFASQSDTLSAAQLAAAQVAQAATRTSLSTRLSPAQLAAQEAACAAAVQQAPLNSNIPSAAQLAAQQAVLHAQQAQGAPAARSSAAQAAATQLAALRAAQSPTTPISQPSTQPSTQPPQPSHQPPPHASAQSAAARAASFVGSMFSGGSLLD